jgi:hypothetical protein
MLAEPSFVAAKSVMCLSTWIHLPTKEHTFPGELRLLGTTHISFRAFEVQDSVAD